MRNDMTLVPAPAGRLGMGGIGTPPYGDVAARQVAGQPVLCGLADSGVLAEALTGAFAGALTGPFGAVLPVPTAHPAVRTRLVPTPAVDGTTTHTVITQTDPTTLGSPPSRRSPS